MVCLRCCSIRLSALTSMSSISASWQQGLLELASAYPGLSLDSDAAVVRVREGLSDAEREGVPFAFADYACAALAIEGDAQAIRAILERRLRPLKGRLERFKADGVQPDDVCAELEVKLFEPGGG